MPKPVRRRRRSPGPASCRRSSNRPFEPGAGEVGFGNGSGFEFVIEKVGPFFAQRDGAAQGVEFGIRGAEEKVLCGDITGEGEDGAVIA